MHKDFLSCRKTSRKKKTSYLLSSHSIKWLSRESWLHACLLFCHFRFCTFTLPTPVQCCRWNTLNCHMHWSHCLVKHVFARTRPKLKSLKLYTLAIATSFLQLNLKWNVQNISKPNGSIDFISLKKEVLCMRSFSHLESLKDVAY